MKPTSKAQKVTRHLKNSLEHDSNKKIINFSTKPSFDCCSMSSAATKLQTIIKILHFEFILFENLKKWDILVSLSCEPRYARLSLLYFAKPM